MLTNRPYRAAIIIVSDRGAKGEREDKSGALASEMLKAEGYTIVLYTILPDEQSLIEKELKNICDTAAADLILTTGGTGFSPRDRTPEAIAAVADRLVPGIPEAMRAYSMTITKKAMLSRAAAAIRGNTLIINLPGSTKAVRENLTFIIGELKHGLDILSGADSDCGSPNVKK